MEAEYTARVAEKRPVAEAQVLFVMDVPTDVWSEHIYPAQYVELVLEDMEPWHATIASRPGQPFFEFLVKDVGERSHRISSLEVGDEIGISKPKGKGFPLLAHRKHNLLMVCCGVAICAMRPVIQDVMLARSDWMRVMLFYGERTADRIVFPDEQEKWREMRIETFLSASHPAEGTYWRGHVGWVQDHIVEIMPETEQTVAFLAGKPEMIEEVSSLLGRMNMPPNRVFLNC